MRNWCIPLQRRHPIFERARRAALALIVLLTALGTGGLRVRAQSPQSQLSARHVIVISVDGMGAQFYAATSHLHIPHILQMKSEGSYAEAVEGVYPTVTYPSHTTISTGRMPAEHGIYTNLSSREAGKNMGDWFWFAKAIKVPTLWDEAHRAHLTSASVFWPVTTGAAIDWDFPEIWDPAKGEVGDPMYVAKFTTPGLMLEALMALGPPPAGEDNDVTRTHLAQFLLKSHKPNLLLVHLDTLDATEHQHGPESELAGAALERIDSRIGELQDTVKQLGLAESTDFFIVSDHGFMTVRRIIEPNVLLAQAGLLKADEQGRITGGKVATVSNGGSMFIYWPEGMDLHSEVEAALKPLRGQGLVWRVLDRRALDKLHADPGARLALEAPQGAMFGSHAAGPLETDLNSAVGTHGYLPYREGLEASFIAFGKDIRNGINLHRIPMTAVGPTLLKALGLSNPDFGTQPALDIFKP